MRAKSTPFLTSRVKVGEAGIPGEVGGVFIHTVVNPEGSWTVKVGTECGVFMLCCVEFRV